MPSGEAESFLHGGGLNATARDFLEMKTGHSL